MNAFFSKEFYGNTFFNWGISLLIIFVSILLSKVFYYLISRVLKQITKRTKTKLDDILIDKVEEPAVFAIIITGIWYALALLHFSENLDAFVGHAFYFLVTFNIAWLIARLISAFIDEYLLPLVEKSETDLDNHLLPIARKFINVAIWTLAIIVGLNNAGYDVMALIAGLGLGGLAFALAAKDSLSHIFGGFVLFADKPFSINDRIIVSGFDGKVKEIGMRSTRIQTLDGRLVTLPNAQIANDSIVNISSELSRKTTVDLGLTYDTAPDKMHQAMDILKSICVDNTDVLDEQTITAFIAFGDFSLNIKFIYYIRNGADIFNTMNNINMEVLSRFNEAGLSFAFPTQTIEALIRK